MAGWRDLKGRRHCSSFFRVLLPVPFRLPPFQLGRPSLQRGLKIALEAIGEHFRTVSGITMQLFSFQR